MKAENNCVGHKYIVGIGASAGGLEALQKLLTVLPPDTGFPYIIIQHLSPDYKSMLVHILSKYTSMPVAEAEDGMTIKNDHVYIIQPGKLMTVSEDKLHLKDQIARELNLPIDTFFYSLAKEAGPRAIAIVLSGTGSDGSNGIKAVKEHDGLVIAQDLDSCKFDGMPRSAMRTGLVDAQIAPEEIAMELKHISEASLFANSDADEGEVDPNLMARVFSILKNVSNINFAHYKQATIVRRMERRMMLTHRSDLADYVNYLRESPEEAKTLSREILIGVTGFFRDPEYFQTLKEKALPEILSRATPDQPIRVWVAGCSTGEEAYSIAILFSEVMEAMKLKRVIKIFATDIDADSIEIAGKGVYGDNIIQSVSPARLLRYFTRRNNTYSIKRDIRWMIVFSTQNVLQDAPFGRIDLISCRNMLVYFQPAQQNSLFAIFHKSLRDGGFLFLGKSETVGAHTDAYPVVDANAKVFTHKRSVKIVGAQKLAIPKPSYVGEDSYSLPDDGFARRKTSDKDDEMDDGAVNAILMQRFMPSSIVINAKNELVRSYGDNNNIIRLSAGKFTRGLFDILTPGLMIPVSTLLKEAREKNAESSYRDMRFKGEKTSETVDLTIMPLEPRKSGAGGAFALVFSREAARADQPAATHYDVDAAAARRIADLEQEMGQLRNKLDRSASEQECVNTELQAANEELLTANEELQSSNEELQSVNEELYTVNSEYQLKLSELNSLNDDISNFLSSTMTGIIFVDENLNIRRYTDYMTSEFSVMDQDVGRSLALLSYHFPSANIIGICSDVLKTLAPDEREVLTSRGKVFFMRVAPYRSTENRIMGCVITLMDVTSQKQGQATLLNTEKRLSIAQQAIDAKSDYLMRVARRMQTPINALISLSNSAKALVKEEGELADELGKIGENTAYINAIIAEMSQHTISERMAVARSSNSVTASGVPEVIASVAASRAERDVEDKSKLSAYGLNGLNVLIAEDNALNRTVLRSMLIDEGLTVKETANGEETVRAYLNAPEHAFGCVLMDIRMPKLDGINAAAGIRASGKKDAKSIPIIGILTKGFDDDVKNPRDYGIDATVTKPIDKDELFRIMSKLVIR